MIDFLVKLFLASALGALVGLERQHSHPDKVLGLRTFTLISVFGMLLSFFQKDFWFFPFFGFFAISFLSILFYYFSSEYESTYGMTTALVIPFTYLLGVMSALGLFFESSVTAVIVVGLLIEKKKVHSLVSRISKREIIDLLIFIIFAFVVFPILQKFSYHIPGINFSFIAFWEVVVLVCAITYSAHILVKFLREKGVLFASFFGGIISSMATIALFLKNLGKRDYRETLLVFSSSSSGSIFGDLIILATLNFSLFFLALPFLLAVLAVLLASVYFLFKNVSFKNTIEKERPISLKFVFEFAAIFFLISLFMGFAKEIGVFGLYFSSFVSGMISITSVFVNLAILYPSISSGDALFSLFLSLLGGFFAKLVLVFSKIELRYFKNFALVSFGALLAGFCSLIIFAS